MIGVGISMANGPLTAIFQSIIPHDIQGRVFSIMGAMSAFASPIGLAIAGPLADVIGIRALFYIAGIGTLVTGIICIYIPSVMNLEKHKAGNPTP
jgi:DHA3 family macrolide efflux protein-like MFS transporter